MKNRFHTFAARNGMELRIGLTVTRMWAWLVIGWYLKDGDWFFDILAHGEHQDKHQAIKLGIDALKRWTRK